MWNDYVVEITPLQSRRQGLKVMLLGMPTAEAVEECRRDGFTCCIIATDGVCSGVMTCDFHPYRARLTINRGVVTDVQFG